MTTNPKAGGYTGKVSTGWKIGVVSWVTYGLKTQTRHSFIRSKFLAQLESSKSECNPMHWFWIRCVPKAAKCHDHPVWQTASSHLSSPKVIAAINLLTISATGFWSSSTTEWCLVESGCLNLSEGQSLTILLVLPRCGRFNYVCTSRQASWERQKFWMISNQREWPDHRQTSSRSNAKFYDCFWFGFESLYGVGCEEQ